jgi:CrcB protein
MQRFTGKFPLGTFVINFTGSFLIGLLMTLFTERFQPHPNWRLFLVIGFLGGFTTFSSFEYETYSSARQGAEWIAALNVLASVALGYIAVWFGVMAASRR